MRFLIGWNNINLDIALVKHFILKNINYIFLLYLQKYK